MANFELHSWGSMNILESLETYNPVGAFVVEFEFDIVSKVKNEALSYYFVVCNEDGLINFINDNFYEQDEFLMLDHVLILKKYDYSLLMNFLDIEVKKNIEILNDEELLNYLNRNFKAIYLSD